jgi:hypothetical protein
MKYLRYFEKSLIYLGHDIDAIRNSYFESALWTDGDQNEELEDKTIYDFSNETKEKTKTEIIWFIYTANSRINGALDDITDESIGHDLWLTRNRHGAGFFDRNYDGDISDLLTELSQELGSADLEVYRGKVYINVGSDELVSDFQNFVDTEQYKKGLIQKKYNL